MEGLDTPKKLNEWIIKMGYEEKIPTNLKPFCNPCTALIWEQLVQIVKPKQEIEHIHNNVLINRLLRNDERCLNNSLSFNKEGNEFEHHIIVISAYSVEQTIKNLIALIEYFKQGHNNKATLSFDYVQLELKINKNSSIKEINAWNEKKKLEKQLCAIRDDINESKAKLKSIINNNKVKYVNLENSRQRISESQQCMFLLNKKSEQLETEINDIEEMLTLARNLTPIESEEHNKTEVLETLKMCSEKLEKIIEKQNDPQPMPRTTTESILEQKTPRNKIYKPRRTVSSQKKSVIFSSTKIINQTKIKHKHDHDDSLGLLDELSMTFDSTISASSFRNLNFSDTTMCYDMAILNDKKLNNLIEDALYKNDRYILWNVLCELNKNCKTQLIDLIVENDKKTSSVSSIANIDRNKVLLKLYAMHIDHELKTRKIHLNTKQLQKRIQELEEATFDTLTSMNASPQVIDYLKLQQKEAGLFKGIEYIHKTINSMRQSNEKQISLEIFKEKISNLDENIHSTISSIEHKCTVFKQVYDLITQARNETCVLARKLGQFTLDCNWTSPLNSNLSSVEIETFLDFPLEYNRKAVVENQRIFYRDVPINYISYQEDLDSNSVYMLVNLLQNPCSPAETLLMEIIRTKLKMDQYKSLIYISENFETKGYTLDELRNQESYITYSLEKLSLLIHTASSTEATSTLRNVKDIISLWMEMPIKNFISSKRQFNGLPYSHYEKLYENFYKQM